MVRESQSGRGLWVQPPSRECEGRQHGKACLSRWIHAVPFCCMKVHIDHLFGLLQGSMVFWCTRFRKYRRVNFMHAGRMRYTQLLLELARVIEAKSVELCVLRVGGGRSGGGPAHDWCAVILIMLYTTRIAGRPFYASRLCQIHAIPISSPCYIYAVPIGYIQLLLQHCSFYKMNAYHLASMIVTLVTCSTYLLYTVHIDYLLGLLQASTVFWIHAVLEVH